ncbi:MAG TPA: hypothetical protein VGA36_01190, partial [Nitriliruptorales bacterium]
IADAADRVNERLAGAAADVARVVAARRVLEWLDRVPATWGAREQFPTAPVPDTTVPIGTNRVDALRLLEALAAWARPHEPEPPAVVPCRFCGVPFRPTDDSDFCQPRCEHSARARAVQIEEQQANSTRVAG